VDNHESALIGVRWVLDDSLQWRRTEPKHAGSSARAVRQYARGSVPHTATISYTLPTLFAYHDWAVVRTAPTYGTLTPDGEKPGRLLQGCGEAFGGEVSGTEATCLPDHVGAAATLGFKGPMRT